LTSRLKNYDFESGARHMEITVTDGELAFVGIPTSAMTAAMRTATFAEIERME